MPTDPEGFDPKLLRQLRLAGIVAAVIAVVVIVAGLADPFLVSRAVARWTVEQQTPTVGIVKPVGASGANTLLLPGTLQAFYSAPIYARVPGYLHTWYKDIGAKVRKGDVLGMIDTPDLDQQIQQAKGD